MDQHSDKVIVGQMYSREKQCWTPTRKTKGISKQLLRNTGIFAAVSLCIGCGVYLTTNDSMRVKSVMSHLTAGFEYDESLGRLQFVREILPESAMVFLTGADTIELSAPARANPIHEWSSDEPWIEYAYTGPISACSAGEVVNVVKNRQNEYTVRILHDMGYESVYSGLSTICVKESDTVDVGAQIGSTDETAAFEIRNSGISILPVFSIQ